MAIELRRATKSWSSRISLQSTDTNHKPAHSARQSKTPSPSWRSSLIIGANSCLVVFALNLGVTIWSTTLPKGGAAEGGSRRILKEGTCPDIRKLNVGIHLLINILSSVLLAASNYGMQCLSAPTRADIDKAHFRGAWLDIGIPSTRNLVDIPRKRAVLWGLLVLSSVPLHLFYNSVIFSSLSAVDYVVVGVNETESNPNSTFSLSFNKLNQTAEFQSYYNSSYLIPDIFKAIENTWDLARSNKLENLTTSQCIDKYATAFQTSRQHVLLVSEPHENSTWEGIPLYEGSLIFGADTGENAYDWICNDKEYFGSDTCRSVLPKVKKQAADWAPFGNQVKYCLSKRVSQHCRLNFSPYLLIIVLVSNALKAAVLLYAALRPPEEPLFVLGDAIESFLSTPDAFSTDSCLASANDVKRKGKGWTGPRQWAPVKRRWAAAISRRRWIASVLIYLVILGVSLFFLIFGILQLGGPKDFKSIWNLGYGAVTEVALIKNYDTPFRNNNAKITVSVLLANIPQFIFSGLYFLYNALFTGMLAAKEWSDFGRKRKGLRVSSDPKGAQRSRYFLQLPYRWSIPLLLMSILVHWMLSQSIFVVAVDKLASTDLTAYDITNTTLYSTCGYSPIAIITVILTSFLMVLAVIFTACCRLPTAIPVVGSCSLAIAAACHYPNSTPEPDKTLMPLKWGVMCSFGDEQNEDGLGHCGFSSEYVEEPTVCSKYS